jgi:hypothetical protein
MTVQRVIQRVLPLAAIALVGAAPIASAQRQEIFEWSGRVDRGIQISMRGNQLGTRDLGDSETGRTRSRVMMQLPRRDGQVLVQLLSGRGNARVIEQPSWQNGYTAVVQVDDPERGADDYRLVAYWQNYSNGDVYGNNRNNGVRRGDTCDDCRDCDERDDRDNHDNRTDRRDRQNDDRMDRRARQNADRNDEYGNNCNNANTGTFNRRSLLHWSGNVDGELELRIQNGRVDYRTLSGAEPTSVRADGGNNASIPRGAANVRVVQNQGRGSVTVVEQPSSYNGYTTVLRVRDPQAGYGFYDFDLTWQ